MDTPLLELGFAGTPLRDRLVAAVLDGSKTTTTGLLADYRASEDPLPVVGDRFAVPDGSGAIVAEIEIVAVQVIAIADVDLQHVIDEGEGDESVAQWRRGHTAFFESAAMREVLGDPTFTVDDETPVVAQRFRVVARY